MLFLMSKLTMIGNFQFSHFFDKEFSGYPGKKILLSENKNLEITNNLYPGSIISIEFSVSGFRNLGMSRILIPKTRVAIFNFRDSIQISGFKNPDPDLRDTPNSVIFKFSLNISGFWSLKNSF